MSISETASSYLVVFDGLAIIGEAYSRKWDVGAVRAKLVPKNCKMAETRDKVSGAMIRDLEYRDYGLRIKLRFKSTWKKQYLLSDF